MFVETILGVAQLGIHPSPYRPRPSVAGPERCLRSLVYKARHVPEPPPGRRLSMIFRDGHAHEDTSLEFLKQSLFVIHDQQRPINIPNAFPWRINYPAYRCPECTQATGHEVLIPSTTLHGHIDALATGLDGRIRLFEHKAVVSHFFLRYWEEEKTPLDYFTQVVFYFRGLSLEGLAVTEGALVIKNKDTGALLEYEFEYDFPTDRLTVTALVRAPGGERKTIRAAYRNLYQQSIARFQSVDDHTEHQTLPARLPDHDDIRCQYCPHSDICWEGYTLPIVTEHVMMPEDLRAQALDFITIGSTLHPLAKRHQELKDLLKTAFLSRRIKSAVIGTEQLVLTTGTQTKIDQSTIPTILRAHFSKTTETVRLDIKPVHQAPSKPTVRNRKAKSPTTAQTHAA